MEEDVERCDEHDDPEHSDRDVAGRVTAAGPPPGMTARQVLMAVTGQYGQPGHGSASKPESSSSKSASLAAILLRRRSRSAAAISGAAASSAALAISSGITDQKSNPRPLSKWITFAAAAT